MKNRFVLSTIHYHNLIRIQNGCHIRNQRENLHRIRCAFREKNFFEKSSLGDHGQNFIKTQLGGGTGDFMAENIFPKSTSDSMQIFTLISNMTSVLDSN